MSNNYVGPNQLVVAKFDEDGWMTGDAEVLSTVEADELWSTGGYRTFGTWEAFEAELNSERTTRATMKMGR